MNAALARISGAGSSRVRTIVTPEGIALPLTLSSRGTRFGALLLDLMFVGMLIIGTTIALLLMLGGTAGLLTQTGNAGALGNALQFLAVLWIALMFLFRNAYFMFFELGPRGATPGKRIVGIRIAARDGGRLTAEMVLARNLLRDIELFLPLVFLTSASDGGDMGVAGIAAAGWFLLFALFPFFNRDRLRAGDIIAGTWVVEAPRARLETVMTARPAPAAGPEETAQPAYRFGEAELSVYGELELKTLERVLRDNQAESLRKVYEAICTKIGWQAGSGGDERAFLEEYYTQLRARLETGMRLGRRKADKFG